MPLSHKLLRELRAKRRMCGVTVSITHVTRELNITECTLSRCYITHVTRESIYSGGAYLCHAKIRCFLMLICKLQMELMAN